MAEQSEALQMGMAAMSALVFSKRLDAQVKPMAFALYSLALKELQMMLDQPSLSPLESQCAMAAAMQLSTFDVSLLVLPLSPLVVGSQKTIPNYHMHSYLFALIDGSALRGTIPNVLGTWKARH